MIRIRKRYWTLLTTLVIVILINLLAPRQINKPVVKSAQTTILNADEAVVTEVIDGDTIVLDNGKHVRYIGIDAPETHASKKTHCFGQEAAKKNGELVLGRRVRLEKDVSETDRYGRLLRYVYVDNVFIDNYLVRQGYAVASTFPPDVKYRDQFRQAQEEARVNNRGLWSLCK